MVLEEKYWYCDLIVVKTVVKKDKVNKASEWNGRHLTDRQVQMDTEGQPHSLTVIYGC